METREGKEARIVCTNVLGNYPVVAEIEGTNSSELFSKDGKWFICDDLTDSHKDLFFTPVNNEGWVNIFRGSYGYFVGQSRIYKSKEEAEKEGEGYSDYITTIKIEWKE